MEIYDPKLTKMKVEMDKTLNKTEYFLSVSVCEAECSCKGKVFDKNKALWGFIFLVIWWSYLVIILLCEFDSVGCLRLIVCLPVFLHVEAGGVLVM